MINRQRFLANVSPVIVALAPLLICVLNAGADENTGRDFVLRFCVQCHGPDLQESDLRLDSQMDRSSEAWHKVWRQVQALEMPPEEAKQPSEVEREMILNWIVTEHGEPESPADADHWSLHAPIRPSVPTKIWSTLSESTHDDSGQRSNQTQNAIDAFVFQRLDQSDLSPSPPTDRRTLLRRVTLDLTGLLPTRQETAAFLDDSDDFQKAYARVIDRLLQSPRYGERWAQHWLDVIRWAETVGFETNAERADAWHYRDWVIRAFNEDKPYDQFLSDQLIGDESANDAALGFLVAGPANLPGQIGRDEEAMRQARQDELDEVIRTVSQGLFGLTVGCARCHDHKFDPISQSDYYSMQAIFAGLRYGYRRLRGPINDQWTDKVPETTARLERLRADLDSVRKHFRLRKPLENVESESFAPVEVDAVRMEILATGKGAASLYEFQVWAAQENESDVQNVALASEGAIPTASSFALANQTRHYDNLVDGSIDRRQSFPWVAAKTGPAWIQVDLPEPKKIDRVTWHNGSSVPANYEVKVHHAKTGDWITVAHTRDRLPRTDDTRAARDVDLASLTREDVESVLQLIAQIRKAQQELNRLTAGPQTYAASFSDLPASTMLLRRGDPMQPIREVFASAPTALTGQAPTANPQREFDRRKMLVDHLSRQDHPLAARVMVNRIWQHHFGIGLVETASDFGRMGAPPTHPDLLDWLAVELVENGWSLKHLHRQIVSSKTYTQSSRPRDDAMRVDADARLLWRYPPRRLDAEAIRDSVLMASGKLNLQMYGRGFDFFNQRGGLSDYRPKETFETDGLRRMIYAHKIRMQSVDVFGAFDCPDAGQMTPRRNRSITPIQSLGLLNSPFINRQAEFFAQRIGELADGDLSAAIRIAFEIALTRVPTKVEEDALLRLARDHGLDQACRVILNTSEFVSLQ